MSSNNKTTARYAAVQIIYQHESLEHATKERVDIHDSMNKIIDYYKNSTEISDFYSNDLSDDQLSNEKLPVKPNNNLLNFLVMNSYERAEIIDKITANYLVRNFNLDNLPKLAKVILRVAICEMNYYHKTPFKVIVSEYTNIAGEMLPNHQIGFINSILDKHAKIMMNNADDLS